MEKLSFLSEEHVRCIQKKYSTPVFAYDQNTLESQAQKALDFPNASIEAISSVFCSANQNASSSQRLIATGGWEFRGATPLPSSTRSRIPQIAACMAPLSCVAKSGDDFSA